MSATTALLVALAAFFAAVADVVRKDGLLERIANGVRSWWRRKHPLPLTPAENAAATKVEVDGRVATLSEHVDLLKDLVATANSAAEAADRAAQAAQESAAAAKTSAAAARTQLDRWHQWAVRWWPVLRADAERLGVPDPPAMDDPEEVQ